MPLQFHKKTVNTTTIEIVQDKDWKLSWCGHGVRPELEQQSRQENISQPVITLNTSDLMSKQDLIKLVLGLSCISLRAEAHPEHHCSLLHHSAS